jgi:hypothetical protein
VTRVPDALPDGDMIEEVDGVLGELKSCVLADSAFELGIDGLARAA